MKQFHVLFFLLFTGLLSAQLRLVTDLNPGTEGAFECFLCLGQRTAPIADGMLVVAGDNTTGQELYFVKDDSISLVKDVFPGDRDGRIQKLTPFGGLVYFSAISPEGPTIWVSDGTPEGTDLFFDPSPTTASLSSRISDFAFGADSALYVVSEGVLHRYKDGVATQLATSVIISTEDDNFPGGSFTPYQDGVAFFNINDLGNGGLFLATDTLARLAPLPSISRFDQAFGLREVNGNLLFSYESTSNRRKGTYRYENGVDTLQRYNTATGSALFISRWYTINDSLRVGFDGNRSYLLFDALNEPFQISTTGPDRFTATARQEYPSIQVDSVLIWLTNGGIFNPEILTITDGTVAGTRVLLEGEFRGISNLLHDSGNVYFVTGLNFRNGPTFYRYELSTETLTSFHTGPTDVFSSYDLQLVAVLDSMVYFTSNHENPLYGRELYQVSNGLFPVSTRGPRRVAPLDVSFTSETYTIQANAAGMANVSVFDLGGRLIERQSVPVNTTQPIGAYRGLRIYVFEFAGKMATRRLLGR